MAKKSLEPTLRPADLSTAQIRSGIPKLERRISEINAINLSKIENELASSTLDAIRLKLNATLRDIFGADTIEYSEHSVESLFPYYYWMRDDDNVHYHRNTEDIQAHITGVINKLNALKSYLEEQTEDDADPLSRTVRAYEGLELHPEIARAASKLYKDGHYSTAVEAAVKRLNGLVRMRSDLEVDGSTLMEQAFNPKTPKLRFNALADQSDKDEQRGFMMMFSGAVAGLRNPRAHGFIEDDPERALEFIAFVSLLAKLLDGAQDGDAGNTA